MILITGATGSIGSRVARVLGDRGIKARTLYRKDADGDTLRRLGHEPVRAALEDRAALVEAMRGCDRLFLLPPPVEEQAELETNVITAAGTAGIERILKISAADANVSSQVPWANAHAQGELALHRSGMNWTILRPSAFFQNFLQLAAPIKRGFLPVAAGEGKAVYVDARDVGDVAGRLLIEDGHDRATYFLTGPEALSVREIATTLSKVRGRRVRYIDLPSLAYRLSLRLAGLDAWLANGLVKQYRGVVAGGHDFAVTGEVERLIGRAPRRFADFAEEQRAVFG